MVGILLLTGASVTATILVLQAVVLPLLFKYSKSVQRKIVFSNCINYPRNTDYDHPSSCNIVGGRNFFIKFASKVDNCTIKLGAWHMIPRCLHHTVFVIRDCAKIDEKLYSELVTTEKPVVLYCHGNANNRASPHRLHMYRVLQELNYHVIAFDYRGYGDSTKVRPTEKGLVEDLLQMYLWLREVVEKGGKTPAVIIWGHSLGTAVAAHMVAELSRSLSEKLPNTTSTRLPNGLILEAPFNNLTEEISKHPCSKLVRWLPYYSNAFVKPFMTSSEYAFKTDEHLSKVTALPILILHSKEDCIVPIDLALKLERGLRVSRASKGGPLVFHSYDKGCGLGHNNLCEAPDLPHIVSQFVSDINKTGSRREDTNDICHCHD